MSYTISISSKGQIVIPAELRRSLGLATGTQLRVTESEGHLILSPVGEQLIPKLQGSLSGASLVEDLKAWRSPDRW